MTDKIWNDESLSGSAPGSADSPVAISPESETKGLSATAPKFNKTRLILSIAAFSIVALFTAMGYQNCGNVPGNQALGPGDSDKYPADPYPNAANELVSRTTVKVPILISDGDPTGGGGVVPTATPTPNPCAPVSTKCVPSEYSTITAAYNAAGTVAGDVILVAPGNFTEELVITKSGLTIRGTTIPNCTVGDCRTIVRHPTQHGPVFTIRASNTTLDSLDVAQTETFSYPWLGPAFSSGILVDRDVSNVVISNSRVYSNIYGIAVIGAASVTVTNSLVGYNHHTGIYFQAEYVEGRLVATNNHFLGNATSINFSDVGGSVVLEANRFTGSCQYCYTTQEAVHLHMGAGAILRNNIFVDNVVGVRVDGYVSGASFDGNSFDRTDTANPALGVIAIDWDGHDSTLARSTISHHQLGVKLYHSTDGNTFPCTVFVGNDVDVSPSGYPRSRFACP
jgi:nitrous oxidase accessory protein NosD